LRRGTVISGPHLGVRKENKTTRFTYASKKILRTKCGQVKRKKGESVPALPGKFYRKSKGVSPMGWAGADTVSHNITLTREQEGKGN